MVALVCCGGGIDGREVSMFMIELPISWPPMTAFCTMRSSSLSGKILPIVIEISEYWSFAFGNSEALTKRKMLGITEAMNR